MLLALVLACVAPPPCDDPALTCDAMQPMVGVVTALAGRPLSNADRDLLRMSLVAEARADAARSATRMQAAASELAELDGVVGIEGARLRSEHTYDALGGHGVFEDAPAQVGTVFARAVSEWARFDEERLVLSESDIEGFLRYASLCREVQAGGPLRLSIADRGLVYQALVKRFREGTSQDRTSMLAIGAGFWAARGEWAAASYDRQHEFSVGAPLPPSMTATSVDYALAIVAGDLPAHAANLHATLGPLHVEPASAGESAGAP